LDRGGKLIQKENPMTTYRDAYLKEIEHSIKRIRNDPTFHWVVWSRQRIIDQVRRWIDNDADTGRIDTLRYLNDHPQLIDANIGRVVKGATFRTLLAKAIASDLIDHSGEMMDRAYDAQFVEPRDGARRDYVVPEYEPKLGV
jgi:hypothetical protein